MKTAISFATALMLAITAPATRGAESYDNCAGTISSLPATITTQGTWCMKSDLATAMETGEAITVGAHNVTIECNGFKLGGLAAGSGTQAIGIYASGRQNTVVRGCNIRGFMVGVMLTGSSSGNLVEDNRFDGNTVHSIWVWGDQSTIRRNLVFDTGSNTIATVTSVAAIVTNAAVDVIDNTVAHVRGGPYDFVYGIHATSAGGARIMGNRLAFIIESFPSGGFPTAIMSVHSAPVIIQGNQIQALSPGHGIRCADSEAVAIGNVIVKALDDVFNCLSLDNVIVD